LIALGELNFTSQDAGLTVENVVIDLMALTVQLGGGEGGLQLGELVRRGDERREGEIKGMRVNISLGKQRYFVPKFVGCR
jgi:hypothetical protein